MSLYLSPRASSKRQRLMIITADESIIDEIEKNNSTRLLQQIIFPAANKNEQATDEQILDHDIQRKTQPACQTIQSKDGPLICVICGASAKGYNFGAIACEGCKAFFRRNARKQPVGSLIISLHSMRSHRLEYSLTRVRFIALAPVVAR